MNNCASNKGNICTRTIHRISPMLSASVAETAEPTILALPERMATVPVMADTDRLRGGLTLDLSFFMNWKFFKNSKTGAHCIQACIQTILFAHGIEVPGFDELDIATGHLPGKYTWTIRSLIWLADRRFDVVHIENLDYRKFAEQGRAYLRSIYSNETFLVQEKMSDLDLEQKNATELVNDKRVSLIYKMPNGEDICAMVAKGYSAMVSIDPFALYGGDGHASHMIVLREIRRPADGSELLARVIDPDRGMLVVSMSKLVKAMARPDGSVTFLRYIL